MIDKLIFNELKKLKREYEDISQRLKNEENKTIVDTVRGSSSNYPYTEHTYSIEGIQNDRKYKRYKKMLKDKKKEIGKKILNIEYQINNIDDSEIRTLLRYKYMDGLRNYQIAHIMNREKSNNYTEDSVRMKINRFFEKK